MESSWRTGEAAEPEERKLVVGVAVAAVGPSSVAVPEDPIRFEQKPWWT